MAKLDLHNYAVEEVKIEISNFFQIEGIYIVNKNRHSKDGTTTFVIEIPIIYSFKSQSNCENRWNILINYKKILLSWQLPKIPFSPFYNKLV